MNGLPTTEVRAVLFDLDGVLVDSFESWLAVVDATAEHFGRPPIGREQLQEAFGQGPEDDARLFYPGRRAEEIQAVYETEMPKQLQRIEVGQDTHAVLEALGRSGILRAVVTNTQASLARRILETTEIAPRVDAWFGVTDGIAEKPAPDLLHRALAHFGLDAASAVMVGDSRYDEQAAQAAGTHYVPCDLRAGASLADALAPLLRT